MCSGEDMIIIIVWRPQTTREKARKPVGICGVSSGAWGGTRMVEQFRRVCLAFHLGPLL